MPNSFDFSRFVFNHFGSSRYFFDLSISWYYLLYFLKFSVFRRSSCSMGIFSVFFYFIALNHHSRSNAIPIKSISCAPICIIPSTYFKYFVALAFALNNYRTNSNSVKTKLLKNRYLKFYNSWLQKHICGWLNVDEYANLLRSHLARMSLLRSFDIFEFIKVREPYVFTFCRVSQRKKLIRSILVALWQSIIPYT